MPISNSIIITITHNNRWLVESYVNVNVSISNILRNLVEIQIYFAKGMVKAILYVARNVHSVFYLTTTRNKGTFLPILKW